MLVLIFESCSKNNEANFRKTERELEVMAKYLKNDIDLKYHGYYKQIEGCEIYFRGDSIYNIGNQICADILNNKTPNEAKVEYFYKEVKIHVLENANYLKYCNDNLFENKNIEILKIRILQSEYLNQVILDNMKSHFQLPLIGLEPATDKIKYGIGSEINLRIKYHNYSTMEPIVIIENDTLINDGTYYKFTHKPKSKGNDTVYAKIVAERWGEVRDFKVYFILKNE